MEQPELSLNLTKEQLDIILSSSQHLIVAANAGCGKTSTMIQKIKYLVNNRNIIPSKIMLTSFSRTASAELKEKVSGVLPEYQAAQITIGTLHSICYRILLEYKQLLGISTIDLVDENYLGTCTFNIQCQRNLEIFKSKSDAVSAAMKYRRNLISRIDGKEEIPTAVYDIVDEAQGQLLPLGKLLYDDLILKVLELFEKYPEVKKTVARRYDCIITDECQDLSYIQWKIIRELIHEDTITCCIGDAKQNIYGFRGASYKYMEEFQKDYKAKILPLTETFRFGQPLADLSNKVVDVLTLDPSYKGLTKTNIKHTSDPKFLFCDKDKQVSHIIKDLKAKIASGSYLYKDLNILYRLNKEAFPLMKEFIREAIPFEVKAGDIFQRSELVFVLKVFHLYKEFNLADCIDLLDYYSNDVGDKSLNTIYTSIGKVTSAADFFNKAATIKIKGIGSKKSQAITDMGSRFVHIQEYLRKTLEQGGKLDLLKIATIMDMQECKFMWQSTGDKSEDPIDISAERWDYLNFFQEIYQDSSFMDLLEWYQDVALDGYCGDKKKEDVDKVQLKTTHGSKGQSLPVVYLLGNEFFNSFQVRDLKQYIDENFVLYVASTRAEKELFVYVDNPYKSEMSTIFPSGWNSDLLDRLELNYKRYDYEMSPFKLREGVDVVDFEEVGGVVYLYFKGPLAFSQPKKLSSNPFAKDSKDSTRIRTFINHVGYSNSRYYLHPTCIGYIKKTNPSLLDLLEPIE